MKKKLEIKKPERVDTAATFAKAAKKKKKIQLTVKFNDGKKK